MFKPMLNAVARLGRRIESLLDWFVARLPDSWVEAMSRPEGYDFDEVAPVEQAMAAVDGKHFSARVQRTPWENYSGAFLRYFRITSESKTAQVLLSVLEPIYNKLSKFDKPAYVTFAAALAQAFSDDLYGAPPLRLDKLHQNMAVFRSLVPPDQEYKIPLFWDQFYFGLTANIDVLVWRAVCWMCVFHDTRGAHEWITPEKALELHDQVTALLQDADPM